MMSRNSEHYIVMTAIYNELTDHIYGDKETFRDVREIISSLADMPFEQVSPYVKRCVEQTLIHYGEIVTAYKPYLRNWRWERIPAITQSVLLMSYAHFYYVEKVDKKIVINVAVDLAKKYIDEKQAKFINAVLDGILQSK